MKEQSIDIRVEKAMDKVTSRLPGGGEARPGQRQMAQAVARSIETGRHLVIQAGTGTGKSLAYLVPAVLSGRHVVVATATKALQDQLATRDLPLLKRSLAKDLEFAVLKGRSNYLCRQRVGEMINAGPLPGLEHETRQILSWARKTGTGDRAELSFEAGSRAWGQVSVGTNECPGRSRCPNGNDCFAEMARERAGQADVVVTNMHLYGAHLANGGAVLPDHDVVVFDEAHELEDVATACLGLEISSVRLRNLASAARPLLGGERTALASELDAAGDLLDAALAPQVGRRLESDLGGPQAALSHAIAVITERLSRLTAAMRQPGGRQGRLGFDMTSTAGALADPARARALQSAGKLAEGLATLSRIGSNDVAWVEGRTQGESGAQAGSGAPSAQQLRDRYLTLRVAPIEVAAQLAQCLWGEVTAILTSATVPFAMGARLGIPAGSLDEADVGSPFPYATNALLYCAAHLPDRRHPDAEPALQEELASLINVAGGRTLALFTSWRGMHRAARAVRPLTSFQILTQDELPKAALLATFSQNESVCLFATMGFWQGVDLPGPTLSLVVIDRIPFPRPDDPLVAARRERAGPTAFRTVDLPRAAMMLAQGAGRLIRSSSDRGVVAVLDRRLAHASYRWDLVRALPPMARTRDRLVVDRFLTEALAELMDGATPT
ncbi:MAG: ATP-dependent DNA helicase [Acidimicrobiales bacterium]